MKKLQNGFQSMNSQLSVAIKIPTFNAQATVQQTLKSLLNQTHQNFIIYIYDNCSTDSTLDIIRNFNDPRIMITVADENHGWKWNFDRCLDNKGSLYTLFAHSDDVYHPDFININLTVLSRNEELGLVFSRGLTFSDYNKISPKLSIRKPVDQVSIRTYSSLNELLREISEKGNFIFCPTAFGRSEIFSDLICEFNEEKFGGSADLDAWLRVIGSNCKISIINSPTIFYYRTSEGQISEVDRGLETGSVFVKCLRHHLELSGNEIGFTIDKLSALVRWHELFFMLIKDLKNYYRMNCDNSRVNIKYNFFEVISLKGVPPNKLLKHISLILMIKVMRLMSSKIRILISKFLLEKTR